MKKIACFLILFTSISCFADVVNRSDAEMRNASKEGRDAALSSPNNSFNTNMNEFSGYQSKPKESNFYKGITSTSTDLNQKGNETFKNSEIKSVLEDSIKNNPRDDIKWDSEIIQNGLRIKDNADVIVGGTGNQCVKQVVNKSSFENFYCEKDNQVQHVCTIKQKIRWITRKQKVFDDMNFLVKYSSFKPRSSYYGYNTYYIPAIKTGKLHSIEIIMHDYYSNRNELVIADKQLIKRGRGNNRVDPKYCISNCNNIKTARFSIPMDDKHVIQGLNAIKVTSKMTNTYNHHTLWEKMNFDVYFKYSEVEGQFVEIEEPELFTESTCDIDKGNAIEMNNICLDSGQKTFVRNGKTYNLNSDCWDRSITYLINDVSDNECRTLEQKTNCTVGKRECISSLGNTCLRFGITYQCQNIQKQEGYLCGGRFYCDDGSCAGLTRNTNRDFGQAVSQLAALYKAGKDFALNNGSLRAFSGKVLMCRKTGFGFSNCCKDSGWGQSLGIAHCNSEEKELGVAKEKKLAIYVGTFCDKKVLGVCIRKKSSYCAFDNKLARIIQLQGRSGQLHIGFGSAESPDCRGLSVEELQSIKFDNINYSDFFDELDNNKRIPDNNVILDYMKGSIKDKFGK